jgi:hypothetical protein
MPARAQGHVRDAIWEHGRVAPDPIVDVCVGTPSDAVLPGRQSGQGMRRAFEQPRGGDAPERGQRRDEARGTLKFAHVGRCRALAGSIDGLARRIKKTWDGGETRTVAGEVTNTRRVDIGSQAGKLERGSLPSSSVTR